jgi:tetratricopeptide (TPR) repeat protein
MSASSVRATVVVLSCAVLLGCVSTPPAMPPIGPVEDLPQSSDSSLSPQSVFEQQQRERALGFARQRRLSDAALAWEVLTVLRPDVVEYGDRLADTQRQIDAAVAERLPRAAQTAQRGDVDAAAQQYLAVLALQPRNEAAADALRALERERNKRNYLGKYSRITITRRAIADAEMPINSSQMAGHNEVEHAAMLAGDGEFDDAIGLLEHWLAVDRRDTAARRQLANVYYRKAESLLPRDKSAAVKALEKSVRLDPTEPRAAARLRQLKGGAVAPPAAAASAVSPGRTDLKPVH